MIKNREEAEELTQDIFVKIYNGLSDFRGESQLKTWIYRITVNTCISKLNSKQFREFRNQSSELNVNTLDSVNHPEKNFILEEDKSTLEIALNELSSEYRQILLLFYIEELSYKEIAVVLDLPIGTICTKLYRARRELKKMLQELKYEM
jgi:RNA polymerase sigma-70 factor (ECF subfamily)